MSSKCGSFIIHTQTQCMRKDQYRMSEVEKDFKFKQTKALWNLFNWEKKTSL